MLAAEGRDVFDSAWSVLPLTVELVGWDEHEAVSQLRKVGSALLIENDVAMAAYAELDHDRDLPTFEFVSERTGLGIRLVIDDEVPS